MIDKKIDKSIRLKETKKLAAEYNIWLDEVELDLPINNVGKRRKK